MWTLAPENPVMMQCITYDQHSYIWVCIVFVQILFVRTYSTVLMILICYIHTNMYSYFFKFIECYALYHRVIIQCLHICIFIRKCIA